MTTVVERTAESTGKVVISVGYRDVLRVPYATRLLAGTLVGRLPSGMAPLAILLIAAHGSGYATASGLAALYLVATAAGGPPLGRLVDRHGQTTVLTAAAAVSSGAVLILAVGHQQPVVAAAAVLVAGAAAPPLEAGLRALWGTVMPTPEHVRVALALDSASQELVYVAGPLLVSGIAEGASPFCALLATVALGVIGTTLVVTTRVSRVWSAGPRRADWLGPARSSGLRALFLAMMCVGVPIGGISVVAVGTATRFHHAGLSGTLPAVLSAGAFLGGLAYGALSWRGTTQQHLLVLSCCFAASWLPLLSVGSPTAALAATAFPGLFMAPLLGAGFVAVAALAPPGMVTEANALLVAAIGTGCALGTAAAGLGTGDVLLPAGATAASVVLFATHRRLTLLRLSAHLH